MYLGQRVRIVENAPSISAKEDIEKALNMRDLPSLCFVCAGPLDTDGVETWCSEGCSD